MKIFNKLKNKKTIYLCLLLLCCIVKTWFIYYNYLDDLVDSEVQRHLGEINNQIKNDLNKQIQSKLNILYTYSKFMPVTSNVLDEKNFEYFNYELSKIDIDSFVICNDKGLGITNSNETIYYGNELFFKEGINGFDHVSTLYSNKQDKRSYNIFSIPIYSNNKVTGVLGVKIYSEETFKIIDRDLYDGKAKTYILDDTGTIIVDNRNKKINSNVIEILSATNDNKKIDSFTKALSSNKTSVTKLNIEGENTYLALSPLENKNKWYLVTKIDSTYASEDFLDLFSYGYYLMLLVITILGGVTLFIAKKEESSNNEISSLAYYDPNLNCPNINKFLIEVDKLLKKSRNYAIIELDLCNFKLVNEMFGYEEGNKILANLVNILETNLNDQETYAREYDDCFVMLLEFNSEFELLKRLQIIDKLISNYTNKNLEHYELNIAWGIYPVTEGYVPINQMIDKASVSRKSNKNPRRSSFTFFDENMKKKIEEEMTFELTMKKALKDGDFTIEIQPIVNPRNSKAYAGEALVRWIKNDEFFYPYKFIKIFEKTDLIYDLDTYVLELVCKEARSFKNNKIANVTLSLNMSYISICNNNFITDLKHILSKYALSGKDIAIEIDENSVFENYNILSKQVDKLNALGIKIYLDNFGVGYSSMNLLKDLKIDLLKLDKSFLVNSYDSNRCKILLDNIIEMAHNMGIKVVIEGVDTDEHYEFVKGFECDYVQGFYYSNPIDTTSFRKQYSKK